MLYVPDYYIENDLRVDRNDTLRGIGGGLIVYVRNDVIVRPVESTSNFNQHCSFEIMREKKDRPLNVTLIYRSPNSNAENTLELAGIIEKCKKNSLIIGDYNLPLMCIEEGKSCFKSRPIVTSAADRFLYDLVTFPTHIRGNILDNALCDIDVKNSVYNVENLGNLSNSDHAIIKIELNMSPKFNKTRELVRDWRRGDVEGLKNHLENINFEEIFQDKDANSAWIAFKGTIEDTISRYIPLSPRRKQGDPPWLSKSVKRLINRKQRFWKRFSKNRNDANYERFKSAEKLCKKGVSDAKRKYREQWSKGTLHSLR